MNLPNKLTVARIGLSALFVMALLLPPEGVIRTHFPLGKSVALLLFALAGLTDWLDGWLARRRGIETSFGALLDPLADKVLTTAAFVCFIELKDSHGHSLVQAWMVLLIISREFLITGVRLLGREHGLVLKAERIGKHKTASQMLTIVVVLAGLAGREDWNCLGFDCAKFESWFGETVMVLMVITVALTVISGATFLSRNRGLLRDGS